MALKLTPMSSKKKLFRGMTLVELMVAVAVFAMLLVLTLPIVTMLSKSWKKMSGRAELFSAARAGLASMRSTLQQATLQTHFSYADSSGQPVPLINPSAKAVGLNRSQIPTQYLRASELHFLVDDAQRLLSAANTGGVQTSGHTVFFQAPLGKVRDQSSLSRSTLLNSVGYFVEYGDSASTVPAVVGATTGSRQRYRLMQVVQPAHENTIYKSTLEKSTATGLPVYNYDLDWIDEMGLAANTAYKHVLAENIILLAIRPKSSKYADSTQTTLLAPNYTYDSRWWEPGYSGQSASDERVRNQLPPVVELIAVAIDEASAIKLDALGGGGSAPFSGGAGVNFDNLFLNASQIEQDLGTVEDELIKLGLNYRIFRTDVAMPAAKWSGDQ